MSKKPVKIETQVTLYEHGVLSRRTVKRRAYALDDEDRLREDKKDKTIVIDQHDHKRGK